MTATNEAWISDSLARLEQLESQREQLAAAGRTEALAELDEEIKSLYEVLESAADDDDPAANNSPFTADAGVPHPAFGPTPVPMASHQPDAAPASSHAIATSQMTSPFAAPEAVLAAPAAHLTAAPTMHVDSDDDMPSGGKGGIIAAVVLLLAAGGGGWWYMNRPAPAPAAAAPAGPTKIIQAGAIPDDTQEPDVAKGGDASRTPGITFKEPAKSDERRPSSSRPAGAAQPKPAAKPDKGREIKVGDADDPLAGVR